jgi:hypothetical protein
MIHTMTGYMAKSIDELPTLWDGFAKLVRAGLDITAFGANIMDLPPDIRRGRTTSRSLGSRSCMWRCEVRVRWTWRALGCRWTLAMLCASMRERLGPCRQGRMACACSASAACQAGRTKRRIGARLGVSEAGP